MRTSHLTSLLCILLVCLTLATLSQASLIHDLETPLLGLHKVLVSHGFSRTKGISQTDSVPCNKGNPCAQLKSGKTVTYNITLPQILSNNVTNFQTFTFTVPPNALRSSEASVDMSFIYISCEPANVCQSLPSMGLQLYIGTSQAYCVPTLLSTCKGPILLNSSAPTPSVQQYTFDAHVGTPYTLAVNYPIVQLSNQVTLTYQISTTWPTGSPGWAVFLICVGGVCILVVSVIMGAQLKKELDQRRESRGYVLLV